MSQSLEHNTQFHFVKRIVKIVSPEYRVFSSVDIEHNNCLLDIKRKTIEIGEGTDITIAIGAILFQVGHLKLIKDKRFSEHFGLFETRDSSLKYETFLIEKLARQGALADTLSLNWAASVYSNNWHIHPSKAKQLTAA